MIGSVAQNWHDFLRFYQGGVGNGPGNSDSVVRVLSQYERTPPDPTPEVQYDWPAPTPDVTYAYYRSGSPNIGQLQSIFSDMAKASYGITSVPADQADPKRLLACNRGHWAIENANHYRRDTTLGEDTSRLRARHAPANNATLNNIVLAIVFHRGFRHPPEANLHFMMQRKDALDAILSPD